MKLTSLCFKRILFLSSLFIFSISTAQVGIGTTSPNSDALLDVDATMTTGGVLFPRVSLTSTASFLPLSTHVQGMSVYNIATASDVTPGLYINNGTSWVRQESSPVDSVSLASNILITSTYPTYAPLTGMSLTFTARNTSEFVLMTASGFSFTGSLSGVYLRVYDQTNAAVVGGTMTTMQSFDPFFGSIITTWSCSFSKLMTGLTIGTTYTIRVEGAINGVLGTPTAIIQPVASPNAEHVTLSILH